MNVVRVAIITGSTRPGRNNLAVAAWVHREAKKRRDVEFELVDIADYDLPLLDEPMPPMLGQYTDFEGFRTFKPGPQRESEVHTMLDQVIAWGRALKTVREPQTTQSEMQTI